MKNILKFLVFASFIFLLSSSQALAVEKIQPEQGIVVATVNIYNPKIISQEENIFNISFDISNKEIRQSNIKYGVKLIKETTKDSFTVDEKIYDESLTLPENTTINKKITYIAPIQLSGEYSLFLTSSNDNGFIFAISKVGEITLTNKNKGLQIISETCLLEKINNETDKFSLTYGVNIKLGEDLKITCNAFNSSSSDITVIPKYETQDSSYNNVLNQEGGDMDPIVFKANEKKTFSLILPRVTIPQFYNTILTLENKDIISNSIFIDYVLQGANTAIKNISLDKDYYNKDDLAQVSFFYQSIGESVTRSGIQIFNGNEKACSELQDKDLKNKISPKIDTIIKINNSCLNPKVVVTLFDDQGKILDQRELEIKTTSEVKSTSDFMKLIGIIIVLFLLIFFYFYFKRKKITPITSINIILPFLLVITLFSLTQTKVVEATNFTSNDGYVTAIFYTNKSSYNPGEAIPYSEFITVRPSDIGGDNSNIFDFYIRTHSVLYTTYNNLTPPPRGNGLYGYYSDNLSAPLTVGAKTLYLEVTYSYYDWFNNLQQKSTIFSLPYTVILDPTVTVYVNGLKNPAPVAYDSDVEVKWSSKNATKGCVCTFSPANFSGVTSCGSSPANATLSGNHYVSEVRERTTFSVTCSN